jgi:hypothetical protein
MVFRAMFLVLVLAFPIACGSASPSPSDSGPVVDVPDTTGPEMSELDGDSPEPEPDVPAGSDPGEDPGTSTDLAPDPGPALDPGSEPDPGPVPDPGVPSDDGPAPDPGPSVPLPGFGAVTGECGVLDEVEWGSTQPFLFRNALDFGSTAFDVSLLTPAGQEVEKDGNLGGSSVHSEAIAVEVLVRCELAELLKTEGEIAYKDAGGKKTDELVLIDGRKVGVSVVRAFHYPAGQPYTADEATKILQKKLGDVLLSGPNAAPEDAWQRSVLAVIAYDDQHADQIASAWQQLDGTTKASTIVYVTVTGGDDAFLY